ncbi:hypothetical protein [Streptomyces prasinosporus]|uniref:hypothetical protein n=1 Tax=Streptomyces prasinosporus TaxID=68256 RepID=UPI0031E8BCF4
MPVDGHLLLSADPDPDRIGEGNLGSALHIPAGTPVEERPVDLDPERKNYPYETDLLEGLLRPAAGVSLPYCISVYAPGQPLHCADHPEHPHAADQVIPSNVATAARA